MATIAPIDRFNIAFQKESKTRARSMELSGQALHLCLPRLHLVIYIASGHKRRKISMYAVIKNGGRQYKVSAGQRLEVNRLAVEDGAQIRIGEVLLIGGADQPMIGAPFVENAEVLATVIGQARGEKLIVFKYKAKKRYRHRRGHRQELTVLSIDDILSNGKSLLSEEERRKAQSPKAITRKEAPETESTASSAVSTDSTTSESSTEE
jgi:large subunit ribosomal protein L21